MIRCIAQGSDHEESFPSTIAFKDTPIIVPHPHTKLTQAANQGLPLASGMTRGTGPGVTMVGDPG